VRNLWQSCNESSTDISRSLKYFLLDDYAESLRIHFVDLKSVFKLMLNTIITSQMFYIGRLLFTCPKIVCPTGETERVRSEANHVNLPSRDSMRIFAVHERIRRKVDGGEADGRSGSERRRVRDGRSEVDGGERGRAGVLLRGSVVKRIDPNHYDMSRLRFAASTMAGSSPEKRFRPKCYIL